MRVYVTGASGFVGGHVARILRERGADVRDERVDLLDGPRLERALAGCDALVHVAALYSYRASPRSLARVNIEGTRSVLAAAARAGVARIVHTSTAGTCGPVPDRPATEEDCAPSWELTVPYKSTKLEAERIALAAGAVVVNPTTPVGEGDRRPTPTGAMVRGVARGRLRGFVATTGLNIVDGRDLGLEDLFAQIAAIAERPRPRIRVPYTVARAAGMLGLVNRHEVRLARLPMFFKI